MNAVKNKFYDYVRLMRLDKPIGIFLLYVPCLWGLLAGFIHTGQFNPYDFVFYAVILFMGSVLMRGAGCVINDYFDRHIDARVERTKNRPIASGRISPRHGLIFFALLCAISGVILLCLPMRAWAVGVLSLIPVMIYPLMKRITYWPQIFLGLTFNIGIWVGYVIITPDINSHLLWLYAAGIFHTLGYDTIYAFQDIKDDINIGVKSSARRIQNMPKCFISLFYGASWLCLYLYLFPVTVFGALYILGLFYAVQIYLWTPTQNASSLKYFKMAHYNNLLILICLFLS